VTQPVWLLKGVVLAVHDMQLAEHGGPAGVRDDALLESALARPINLHAYGDSDRCALAAAYAFGIVRNHPFVDGNKRTGFLAAYIFLKMNGIDLIAREADATAAVLALSSGEAGEAEFAAWLRANVRSA
jgi:death-on-curing protein